MKAVPAQHRVVAVAERAGDGTVHGPAEPVVPGRRVPAAHAGRDLRLDRVVLRLEVGLAGTDALDGLLLLLLGRRHLVPLAVGLGPELCDVIPLLGCDAFGVLRLRLLLAEVALGVVELDLEAALALDVPLEATRVLAEVLAPGDHLVGAAVRRKEGEVGRAVAAALVQRERRIVELALRGFDLGRDPVDVALHGLDLRLDGGDLGLCGIDPLAGLGDLLVERRHLRLEVLTVRGDPLQLVDGRDLLGRDALDRVRELVAPGLGIRRRLTAGDVGRDETEQERGRDEVEEKTMGFQGFERTQHESHKQQTPPKKALPRRQRARRTAGRLGGMDPRPSRPIPGGA